MLLTEPIVIERFVTISGEDNGLAVPNLDIQRQIARSVRLSAMADVMQFVVGAVTIGLLLFTFRETRRGATAALEAAKVGTEAIRSERAAGAAYLFAQIRTGIAIQNYGRSSAIAVDIHYWTARNIAPPTVDAFGQVHPDINDDLYNVYHPT